MKSSISLVDMGQRLLFSSVGWFFKKIGIFTTIKNNILKKNNTLLGEEETQHSVLRRKKRKLERSNKNKRG